MTKDTLWGLALIIAVVLLWLLMTAVIVGCAPPAGADGQEGRVVRLEDKVPGTTVFRFSDLNGRVTCWSLNYRGITCLEISTARW